MWRMDEYWYAWLELIARVFYEEERAAMEWIDLGGEAGE